MNKEQQLKNRIERVVGNQTRYELECELKGYQEARKEVLIEVEKNIPKWIRNWQKNSEDITLEKHLLNKIKELKEKQ